MLHPYPPGIAEKVLSLVVSLGKLLMGLLKALWGAENVIQTILGVLFLLAIYALCYWLYLVVGKRRFISIAPFRVWGSSPLQYPGEGIAARLGDELLKLQREMRESHPEGKTEGASFYATHFELPSIAQVTVEYGGFSPEVFNSFLRRLFRREVGISGDMIPNESGLLLVGRSSGVGPWEVHAERSDTSALHQVLQEIAVRAVIDLHPATEFAIGNALTMRQLNAAAAQDPDESLRQARLATMAFPKEGISFYNLGVALHGKGQLDEAIAAYNKALQLEPDEPKALNNLGLALDNKGLFDEAIAALNKALQLEPDDPDALSNLGNALANKGQFDGAIAALNKALQIKPDDPEVLYNLGVALRGKGQLDDAIAAYNKALQIKPDYPKALNNLGVALARKGQLDDAIAAYNKALQIKRDSVEALNNLGAAFADKNQLDDALAAYNKALQIKPDFPEALSNLGVALAGKGQFNDAIAALNKALQLKPDDSEAFYNLGLTLQAAGKKKEARRAFAKAQQLDPTLKPPEPQ